MSGHEKTQWTVRRYSDGSMDVGSQYGTTRFRSTASAYSYYAEANKFIKGYDAVLKMIRKSSSGAS